jgi:hypothetical protein
VLLALRLALAADELCGEITLTGPVKRLGDRARTWLEEETARFLERAAIRCQSRSG